jgi:hypothetical protein
MTPMTCIGIGIIFVVPFHIALLSSMTTSARGATGAQRRFLAGTLRIRREIHDIRAFYLNFFCA